MIRTLPTFFLFILITLEGYVVLSSELLAIRQTIPFVGSGTDTVSIIIAAVLMPLAFGYQAGGRFKPGFNANGKYQSLRTKLIRNILISMIILFFGLSHASITVFFMTAISFGIEDRLILAGIYSAFFLVIPVFLLGQTIPLISNYFSKEKLSQVTGKMLFFSTLGSFLGAIFSTLVLMATIGVHHTAAVNFVILAALILALSKKKFSEVPLIAITIAASALYVNSDAMMRHFNIVENNQYNTIVVLEHDGKRELILNNNSSSMLDVNGRKHRYVEFIENMVIKPTYNFKEPIDILVIGAGAFTLGLYDTQNLYDYIDIDKNLQRISEEYILKDELTDNKTFHPVPARGFLAGTDKQYDAIILDTYLGDLTLPEHLVTREFFETVKAHIKPGGVLAGNFILSPNYAEKFSRKVDDTLRSVFPYITHHVIGARYHLWNQSPDLTRNTIYLYSHHPDLDSTKERSVYTDNINRVFIDKPDRRVSKPDYGER